MFDNADLERSKLYFNILQVLRIMQDNIEGIQHDIKEWLCNHIMAVWHRDPVGAVPWHPSEECFQQLWSCAKNAEAELQADFQVRLERIRRKQEEITLLREV